jgi:hypothetical protein
VAIELPIVLALTRSSEVRLPRRALLVVMAQAMTHPAVWFIFPAIGGFRPATLLLVSEIWAWLGEVIFYAATDVAPLRRAAAVSAVANGISLGLGLAFFG